ncbi:cupin domain-containing protein [Trifolium pratense]|uniref:Cupin domain-containing protein n=1 Tax=Trifolium pratense TaxID=57577 RepID=A0A2K3P629_TRIPR|nr:cupin domain-containing protein [Trifolium pratense]
MTVCYRVRELLFGKLSLNAMFDSGCAVHIREFQSILKDICMYPIASSFANWWEGGPLKIPWSFKEEETMYLLEGKVKVSVEVKGAVGSFEIGGGDLVVFPKGMNITWEVTEPVKKHYSLKKE